jgi:hypothetical protein
VGYGDFAENTTTDAVELAALPVGTPLRVAKRSWR